MPGMKRRSKIVAGAAVLALAAWVAWLFGHSSWNAPTPGGVSNTPAESPIVAGTAGASAAGQSVAAVNTPAPALSASAAIAPPNVATTAVAMAASPTASPLSQAGVTARHIDRAAAMVELQKVRSMINSYHTLFGQNPVGTNAEIMKALMGSNSHQAMLGPPPGQTLNAQGELLDPWGTPYFFHQLSGNDMEIHSAGPDRKMWTSDDLVMH